MASRGSARGAARVWVETWPAPRCGHSAVLLPANAVGGACCRWAGGRPDAPVVLIHGGVGADGVALSDMWLFAPDVQDFQIISPKTIVGFVPKPKAMHACVDVGSKVFFIGGASGDANEKQSAMFLDDSYAIRLCHRKGGWVEGGGPFSGSCEHDGPAVNSIVDWEAPATADRWARSRAADGTRQTRRTRRPSPRDDALRRARRPPRRPLRR